MLDMNVDGNEAQIVVTSTNFDQVDVRVRWSPDMTADQGFVYANIDIFNEKVDVDLKYQLGLIKELEFAVATTFEGYEVTLRFYIAM